MFESFIQSVQPHITRRRAIAASVIGAVALTCAVAGPPVFNALRYDSLVAEQQSTHGQMEDAQTLAVDAQRTFESAAAESLAAYANIGSFISAVDPKLLANRSALDELATTRGTLAEQGGIHESNWKPGIQAVWDPASTPRIPETTSPVTIDGLTFALDRNRTVVTGYTEAADRMNGQADSLRQEIAHADELIEKVLASAKKYGASRDVLKYSKADVLVKVRLAGVIGDLTDESLDPIARFTAFQNAVADVKQSHADAVAEEERLAAEKKAAEERAAKEAAKAEADAKAAAEAEKIAKEEAERKAAEEASKPKPTPTPTPTPAPDPTPTPGIPTPTPSPED